MVIAVQNFIPVLTSEAGSCLTTANWQEINVSTLSCSLESLLFKPGQALFKQKKIADLSHYLGWSGSIVLNAMMLKSNKDGIYLLSSPYDGSKIKLTSLELIEFIGRLKPDFVILPKNIILDYPEICDNWTDAIMPFFSAEVLQQYDISISHGVYFNLNSTAEFRFNEVNRDLLDRWSHLPRYVTGMIDLEIMQQLKAKGVEYIETDVPAKLAVQGMVYSQSKIVDLKDSMTQMQFETIDPDCSCPTCSQKLTKAYLHHLLQHTPLLCQRFLLQHNVYYPGSSRSE